MLTEYRLFRINAGGMVDTAVVLRFADDASALDHAQDFGDGRLVEVWRGGRRIGNVPPRRNAA